MTCCMLNLYISGLLWNFLRKFLRRPLKVYALGACSSQPPSSFAQICPRHHSPSKALLGSLDSGSKVYVFAARSSRQQRTSHSKPKTSFIKRSRAKFTRFRFVPYLQKNNYIKLVFLLDCYACLIQNY